MTSDRQAISSRRYTELTQGDGRGAASGASGPVAIDHGIFEAHQESSRAGDQRSSVVGDGPGHGRVPAQASGGLVQKEHGRQRITRPSPQRRVAAAGGGGSASAAGD